MPIFYSSSTSIQSFTALIRNISLTSNEWQTARVLMRCCFWGTSLFVKALVYKFYRFQLHILREFQHTHRKRRGDLMGKGGGAIRACFSLDENRPKDGEQLVCEGPPTYRQCYATNPFMWFGNMTFLPLNTKCKDSW